MARSFAAEHDGRDAALDAARSRVRMCRCGNILAVDDPRREYCSPRCRLKYDQRDYRARVKLKTERRKRRKTQPGSTASHGGGADNGTRSGYYVHLSSARAVSA